MTPVALTVNGRRIGASVEPRTHLADFLREHCRLTGTHLGCEHGVCGACTVLIDGEPVRACITFAIACDGQEIRTIEGFDDDPLMQRLREAFTREHALQCGFCTPGMLIAAHDIVQRLPGADEERIRVELSGNLCRCTGYLGIVNAVRSVAVAQATAPASPTAENNRTQAPALAAFVPGAVADAGAVPSEISAKTASDQPVRMGVSRFEESFVIARAPAEVWRLFSDFPMMAACLPGARLTEHDARSAKGAMTVKLGPIAAAFSGSASIERDEGDMRAAIRGAGADPGSGSRTRGEVVYRLAPENGGKATRVFIVVEYTLQGMLAQFSRSGLVQELGRRLVAEFAQNLNNRLAGGGAEPADRANAALNLGQLLWHALRARLRKLLWR
jgi:aerobic carbon-monoxide dehydrogenase small subunit